MDIEKTKPAHYDLEASSKASIDQLFKQYIEICNQAMAMNKDQFPYKHLLSVAAKFFSEHPIHLAVYDDQPKGDFSVVYEKDGLTCKAVQSDESKNAWRINLSYLKKVVDHPEKYLENPEKLDLDWLKSRLGF